MTGRFTSCHCLHFCFVRSVSQHFAYCSMFFTSYYFDPDILFSDNLACTTDLFWFPSLLSFLITHCFTGKGTWPVTVKDLMLSFPYPYILIFPSTWKDTTCHHFSDGELWHRLLKGYFQKGKLTSKCLWSLISWNVLPFIFAVNVASYIYI